MGQVIRRLQEYGEQSCGSFTSSTADGMISTTFPDLKQLPPELSLQVLSKLNATDLCLAGCVWQDLANVDMLWQGLCKSQWKHVSIYKTARLPLFSFKRLYLQLDEATLTFNADPHLGIDYLIKHGLVEDTPRELALFLYGAKDIDWKMQRDYLPTRADVVEHLTKLQNFDNMFLPNALRRYFNQTKPPKTRNDYLSFLIDRFSVHYMESNPNCGLTKDSVYVLCYSMLLLSVDLSSPHIKNKMSKREFIRNTRRATVGVDEELAGHLYDNVYLIGHISPKA